MIAEKGTLRERIEESLVSGQPGVWVRSHEPDEVILTIVGLAKEYASEEMPWQLQIWDCVKGLQAAGKDDSIATQGQNSCVAAVKAALHMAELRRAEQLKDENAEINDRIVLVLRNGHREISNNGVVNKDLLMAIQHLLSVGEATMVHLVIMSFPGIELPTELRQQFWVLDHEYPREDERRELITSLLEGDGYDLPDEAGISKAVQTCSGLTRAQVKGVCAISLLQHGELVDDVLFRLKVDAVNQAGLLELTTTGERFETCVIERDKKQVEIPGLGGYPALKRLGVGLCQVGLKPKFRPKGLMLVGPPGTGKTMFCRCLGHETGRLPMEAKLGRLRGSLVGQTEERTEEMFGVADSCEPGILFVDEVEKYIKADEHGLSHETTEHVKGEVLKWMQDHTSDVALICTANDVRKLPPEFGRTGRIDLMFYMGFPTEEAKQTIWQTYLQYFELKKLDLELPEGTKNWVGSDIRGCCFLTGVMRQRVDPNFTLRDAAKLIRPTYEKYPEQIEAVMKWADGVCIDGETGETFNRQKAERAMGSSIVAGHRPSRKVKRRRPAAAS